MTNADGSSTTSSGTSTTVKIDLTNYALKSETATKVDLEALQTIVANKLDKEPMHTHTIAEVDQLQTELNTKFDTSKQYSYAVILSDSEKIPYLEDVAIKKLTITPESSAASASEASADGYIFKVDENSGDLQIYNSDVCILSYNKSAGHWIMGEIDLNNFISEVNDVLVNHYQAMNILMQTIKDESSELSNEVNTESTTETNE